jgi:outer membrane murein-binding lipoprotein Lpp
MRKSFVLTLLSVLLCTILLVGCGSDEPTAEQKKADMDKAFTVIGTQVTRFQELSPKMDSAVEDYKNKKSSASQVKKQLESISASYLDIVASIKKVETPKWLSAENKTKFDEMKTQYIEASEAMSSFVTIFAKIVGDDKATKEDTDKMKQYNEIRKDRLVKGLELVTYFANGNWKK